MAEDAAIDGSAKELMKDPKRELKKTGKWEVLYKRCCERSIGSVFTQPDLESFGVADDRTELLSAVQDLVSKYLFIVLQDRGVNSFRTRDRSIADKYDSPLTLRSNRRGGALG